MSLGFDRGTGKYLSTVATCMPLLSHDRMTHLTSNPDELRKLLYVLMPEMKPPRMTREVMLGNYRGDAEVLLKRHFGDRALVRFHNSNPGGVDIEYRLRRGYVPLAKKAQPCRLEMHSVEDMGFEETVRTEFVLERAATQGLRPAPVEAMFALACTHPNSLPDNVVRRLVTVVWNPSAKEHQYCSLYRASNGDILIGHESWGDTVGPEALLVFEKVAA